MNQLQLLDQFFLYHKNIVRIIEAEIYQMLIMIDPVLIFFLILIKKVCILSFQSFNQSVTGHETDHTTDHSF